MLIAIIHSGTGVRPSGLQAFNLDLTSNSNNCHSNRFRFIGNPLIIHDTKRRVQYGKSKRDGDNRCRNC